MFTALPRVTPNDCCHPMDPNVTRPIPPQKVLYRCSCGKDLELDPVVGGQCDHCEKQISPKALGHALAMTITLHDGSFVLDQPRQSADTAIQNTVAMTKQDDAVVAEDPEIMIGEKFGHFEIISTLGHGGMGQVYRALDTSLQRYVAVKLLRSGIGISREETEPGSRSSDKEVDKLLQEAVSQARVTHPNIVTIYYVGKQDGDPFLAMELVNGVPLNDRIASGEMPFSEIAQIAAQICEALKFSYELDIIHGDIKPSNVLLQFNGIAKLSDFGMARRVSGDSDSSIGGTPNYIAPELLRGDKPSIQSDVYALGVTIYEMSFGELPVTLTGQTIPEWVKIHETSQLNFPTPWPGRLPESWRDVLTKMLDKEPADRYGDYDHLITDLKSLVPGSQVTARIFPRIVAATIDAISVMLLAVILKIGFDFGPWEAVLADYSAVTFLMKVFDLVPIVIYTAVIYFWRQSVGRSLMHIRVVNRYGLIPSSNQMIQRSLLRMQFPWFALAFLLFEEPTKSWLGIVFLTMLVASAVLLLIDLAFMAIHPRSRSLHDLAMDTSVVLDTRT